MEFEIDDKRSGSTCKQIKGKIIIENNRVRVLDPEGYTFMDIQTNGQIYFDPEKWGTSYHLKLNGGYEHTYNLEKKC